MPIREESFRIGCGRYLQGAGYVERIGEEVIRLGTSPLIIGGKTSLEIARDAIEKSVKEKCNKYEVLVHTGTCNEEDATKLVQHALDNGYDVIIGVGGGVICDFAKLCAHFANLPVINVPTSSATCAAYTPLSVRYTPEGRTVGSLHYKREVDGVICDTELIATQPTRLFLAGVFDSLAKYVEIKQRYSDDCPMGLDYAYMMAAHSYSLLMSKTQVYIDNIASGKLNDDVEKVIFTCIAATGVISGIARGSNQTALGHKFYENARLLFPKETKPFLHGEIVGIGLLLQNHFNGEAKENDALIGFMKSYGLPCSVSDIGIDQSEETLSVFYDRLCNSTAIETEDDRKKLAVSLKYLWELKK